MPFSVDKYGFTVICTVLGNGKILISYSDCAENIAGNLKAVFILG
jgi:hypothetical protein